ncbi:DUF1365 domain-containing protein [Prosthecomicrobium pneumaticum]|uniref:DUF1365 domain-containing protein n=1 Tax=Prosthecomicrobium pneumaticum TaxID=81895 RepID=A0A7W9CTA1_9HYPH|nr:DUF1365 family protein [Prosthecomicrobium pneumaticum]MBB5751515.1 hypothetical protein [Prosthecomicrobium pneumaticum]
MSEVSALYAGRVWHQRISPRRHRLDYRMFWMLIDLDELDALDRRLLFFSRGRFNLFSFHDADHGDGSGAPLRTQIEGHLVEAGIADPIGAIRIVAMPRLLGYAFNPLTLYFCYTTAGRLRAIVYEVNNTFGERHAYLIAVDRPEEETIRQTVDKSFYVSPFLDMDMTYRFAIRPPGSSLSVSIGAYSAGEPVLAAAFRGERRALSDRALLAAFFAFPAMTLKVIVGIHWEALKIRLKGIGFRRRPPAPAQFVTVGEPVALPVERRR